MTPLSKHTPLTSGRGFVIIIQAIAVFSLFTSESVTRIFRRLAVDCIQNVFASPTKILTIPAIPTSNVSHVPAYLALCQVSFFQFNSIQFNSIQFNLAASVSFADLLFVERCRNGLGKTLTTRLVITKVIRLSRILTYA